MLIKIYYFEKLNWNDILLKDIKVTRNFVFGSLILKKDNETILHFGFQHLSQSFLNKICGLCGYDNFHSFSFKYTYTKKYKIIFDLQKESPEKF